MRISDWSSDVCSSDLKAMILLQIRLCSRIIALSPGSTSLCPIIILILWNDRILGLAVVQDDITAGQCPALPHDCSDGPTSRKTGRFLCGCELAGTCYIGQGGSLELEQKADGAAGTVARRVG